MRLKRLKPEEEDSLGFVIVGLVNLGWSFRKIEKLIGRHIDVVTRLYSNALDKIEAHETNDSALLRGVEREVSLTYVGDSNELEGYERAIIERQQGRRPTGHKID
jgi:hypothetical protein